MATLAELQDALKNADAAGATDDARQLADAIVAMQSGQKETQGFASRTASNILPSAANMASGIYEAVTSPAQTGMNMLDVAAGGLQKIMPDRLVSALDSENAQRAREKAGAVGEFYKQRYGGLEQAKETLATDPVGAAADLASLLSLGGAGVSRIPTLKKAGQAITKAATYVDPASLAYKGAAKVAPSIGKGVANVVGGIGTFTGGESIQQAAKAGAAGGQAARAFRTNLRGDVPSTDVLDDVKSAISNMGRMKSDQYRSGMLDISKDKTVLGFGDIDKAINDAVPLVSFKSQVKNAKSAEVLQKISDEIEAWKKLDPAEYHTPEGLDALKQKIGGIVESIPFEEKTANLVGKRLYGAVKSSIDKQAPTYSKVMKQYADSTEQINEIERALSAGRKSSADAGMRKLQSLMRNNASTNYGSRLQMAEVLQNSGAPNMMPALAGQALSSLTPRGLGSVPAAATALGGVATANPAAIAALLAQSPRVAGELAYYLGKGGGAVGRGAQLTSAGLQKIGLDPALIANKLYQSGQLNGLLSE